MTTPELLSEAARQLEAFTLAYVDHNKTGRIGCGSVGTCPRCKLLRLVADLRQQADAETRQAA